MDTPQLPQDDAARRALIIRPSSLPTPSKEWKQKQLRRLYRQTRAIDRLANFVGQSTRLDSSDLAGGPIRFGLWLIVIVFGVFGLWACFAPLYSAALARGTIVLNQSVKSIQHLEGGIVQEILVKEGDSVTQGQPLVKLDVTASKARVEIVRAQFFAAKTAEARLIAERDNLDSITFDPKVEDAARNDPGIALQMQAQRQLFESRRRALDGQIAILQQKIEQSKEEIQGLGAQTDASKRQISLLNEEIAAVQKLLASGNAQKPRLLALQRQAADIQGNRGQYQAAIARANQVIGESELEMTDLRNKLLSEVMNDLRDRQEALADLEERLRAAEDILNRVVIVAPQSGIVKGLMVHTKGGVVQPGQKVMDIVPQDDELIVEAQISPQDIDVVHEGMRARIRLTAFKARRVPPVDGTVTTVSPDIFKDEHSNSVYFIARIKVDKGMIAKIRDVKLYPGMPADVQIVTGEYPMIAYFVTPITDAMFHAFREQ